MFGRPEAAAAAKLFVVAAGADATLQAISPVFDAIGQRTFVVSEEPKAANLVKLSGNFLIASVIESLGEAMALVAKAGVDKNDYLEILTSTLFGAPVYKTYGGLIAREEFEPAGFAAELGAKDVRLVLAAGEALQTPLPIASLLRDRFLTLLANGGGAWIGRRSARCPPGRRAARARRLGARTAEGHRLPLVAAVARGNRVLPNVFGIPAVPNVFGIPAVRVFSGFSRISWFLARSASMRLARSCSRVVLRRGIIRPRLGSALAAHWPMH